MARPNKYTLTVTNQTSTNQTYILYQPPVSTLTGPSATVVAHVQSYAGTDNSASMQITQQTYALLGYTTGPLGAGVTVNVSGNTPVTLGSSAADGTLRPGTTLRMVLGAGTGAPEFASAEGEDAAPVGAFEVLTEDGFPAAQAESGKWVIGVGGGANGSGAAPVATLAPKPGQRYQFNVPRVWYVATGVLQTGAVFDPAAVGVSVEVDFAEYPTGEVKIVHAATGGMTVQAE